MEPLRLAVELVRLVVQLVGKEKATELVVSQAAIDEANAAADAIEASRGLR